MVRRSVLEGRYYEDFQVGDVYAHPNGRTISEADNVWFSAITMNASPLHLDREYMAHSEFGKPLVNSAFTLALATGLSVIDVSQNALANLGWDKVRLPAPLFVGDTVYAESEV
ncbi:MAG: MaoC family dehydratase, partial [bacterium]